MDQIVLEPERRIWMPGAGDRNFSFGSTVLVPTTANIALGFYLQVFKAGFNSVSLSRMALPAVLFMSRRLWYLLGTCSSWVKLAQQHI